jgi:hypothetical protein
MSGSMSIHCYQNKYFILYSYENGSLKQLSKIKSFNHYPDEYHSIYIKINQGHCLRLQDEKCIAFILLKVPINEIIDDFTI